VDEKRQKLLARLRETFRVEAAEHLEAIGAGLLAIERSSEVERAGIIERIFREAHSLKGAARAVSLGEVEGLCQELESIFAAAKRDELELSTEILDAIHPALGVLTLLCASPGASPSAEGQHQEQMALAALKRAGRAAAEPPTAQPPALAAAAAPAAPF
jgi:two-component system, chemotaxis family, sensor kinase CheA